MRRTVLLMAMGMMLAGCTGTPQGDVEQLRAVVAGLQQQSAAIDAELAKWNEGLAAGRAMLADPNVRGELAEEVAKKLAGLQDKIAMATPIKTKVDGDLAVYKAKLDEAIATGGIDEQKKWELYGQGVSAVGTSLPAPYNGIAIAIGTGLGLLGGAIARGRSAIAELKAQKQRSDTEMRGVVESVDSLLGSDLVKDAGAAKKELAYAQARSQTGAAEAVQRVKKPTA